MIEEYGLLLWFVEEPKREIGYDSRHNNQAGYDDEVVVEFRLHIRVVQNFGTRNGVGCVGARIRWVPCLAAVVELIQ